MIEQCPGQIFVVPLDPYDVQHDPAAGRTDYVQRSGEWVPESSWYLRRLAEGVLVKRSPSGPLVAHQPPPVTKLAINGAQVAPPAKPTRKKKG